MTVARSERAAQSARRARHAGRQLWLASLGAAAEVATGIRALAGQAGCAGRRVRKTAHEAGKLLRETAEYESRRLLARLDLATAEDLRLLSAHLDTLDRTLERKLDEAGRGSAAATPHP